jgi:ABC-type phosphate/phosphonate transport system substrate-binding protein
MKFEKHKNTENPKGLEERMRKELTDPVVDDLIAARESWDKEFEKRQEERIKKLKEAEEEGRLIFSKDK